MVELLSKLFIKDYKNTSDGRVRRAYGTLVSILGLVLNVILFGAKFAVGVLTGSIAIRADAVNNLSDAGSQMISFISFRISSKPADREHPFGHARIEYVASLIVSFLVLHIGLDLLIESVQKIIKSEQGLLSQELTLQKRGLISQKQGVCIFAGCKIIGETR